MDRLQQINFQSAPKIKPILSQRFASGKNQDQKNIIKYSVSTSCKKLTFHHLYQPSKQFTKKLASKSRLSTLRYDFRPQFLPESFPTTIAQFFSKIKYVSSLTSFTLWIDEPCSYNLLSCFKPLLMSFASLRNFSSLNITFFAEIKDLKLFKMIFKYLKRIPTLTDVKVLFFDSDKLSTSHLDILSAGLAKFHQLCSLKLSFCSLFKLFDYVNQKLTITLPKLHSLTKIDIIFNDSSSLNPDGLSNLFSCFVKMKALSGITLGLPRKCLKDNNKEPISEGLYLLDPSKIRKISLDLYQSFHNDSLIYLSKALRNFTSLKTLDLGLMTSRSFQAEEGGITVLVSSLSSLNSLSSLTIILRLKYDEKGTIGKLAILFENLRSLVSLKLHFEGNASAVQNDEIQLLFSNIGLLKSLRFLNLKFPHKELKDENLATLGGSLKELVFLQDLSLDFSYAEFLTNIGVEALAGGIKILGNLSGLTLCFRKNNLFDNKISDYLTSILRNLPGLYSVDFCFVGCPKITCFDDVLKTLRQMKNIGEIALTLPKETVNTEEITLLKENKVVKTMTIF